jgi:hypothetical protein
MNNPLSLEQQVRLQIALAYKETNPEALDGIYTWVMGSKSSILPVTKFEVVKQ